MRCSAMDSQADMPCSSVEQSSSLNVDNLMKEIGEFTKDITTRVKQNVLVAQGMQTFLKRYKNLTEYGQFHNARLSIVHFIALGGCLEEVSRVHKVDTCADDGEFPSMLCQLVEDANQCQKEKQNSHQEDPRE